MAKMTIILCFVYKLAIWAELGGNSKKMLAYSWKLRALGVELSYRFLHRLLGFPHGMVAEFKD